MDSKFSSFLNYAACSVLVVAFLALIIGSFTLFKGKNVQQYQVVLTVNPDSSFDAETFSYYTDSLIQVINKHEHVLEDRYNAILEEKQDAQRYWSIAGVVASIIIAVFGVFGYKSFKKILKTNVKILLEQKQQRFLMINCKAWFILNYLKPVIRNNWRTELQRIFKIQFYEMFLKDFHP